MQPPLEAIAYFLHLDDEALGNLSFLGGVGKSGELVWLS